ncbi:uncharacterized protein V1510DRAFT_411006 [Dipodascopsis tothii]|uniref:uncharacterized protein n=1 Tax=Dipodascopsis tothii TaxID=44089 RepID=UPI0034CF9852
MVEQGAGTKRGLVRLCRTLVRVLTMKRSDIVLEYFDVAVYREDFDNLQTGQWLNDNNLTFWFEYVERTELNDFNGQYPDWAIVLLRPSMVFLLANSDDPAGLVSALPPLDRSRYVFMPVNDNQMVEMAEGGSHWSLLVVDRATARAYYYDSLGDANLDDARTVAHKMALLLGVPGLKLYAVRTPQQANGSDCGIMVCMVATCLMRRIAAAAGTSLCEMPTAREPGHLRRLHNHLRGRYRDRASSSDPDSSACSDSTPPLPPRPDDTPPLPPRPDERLGSTPPRPPRPDAPAVDLTLDAEPIDAAFGRRLLSYTILDLLAKNGSVVGTNTDIAISSDALQLVADAVVVRPDV